MGLRKRKACPLTSGCMSSRAATDSRVTIHMAASLDGFIARKDGSVDWLETPDEFAGGETMDPGFVEAFLGRMPSPRASRRSSLFDPADLEWWWDPTLREAL